MKKITIEERRGRCQLSCISFLIRNERRLLLERNPHGFSEEEKIRYLRGLRKIKRAAGAWGPDRARFYLDLASPSLRSKILMVLAAPTS